MKELQIENISWILNHFYFLIYEHYSVKDITIGLRSYPSVVFKNHQFGIDVNICGSDLGCECNDYEVYIIKKRLFSTHIISVSKLMDKNEQWMEKEKNISSYSNFIQQNLMPVIRGEKWGK
ncbi:MAG: hypothetical protein IKW51_05205 [Bacteroidales bacterium]|nr:hypothetical protein [Bacteroidales bacterium]